MWDTSGHTLFYTCMCGKPQHLAIWSIQFWRKLVSLSLFKVDIPIASIAVVSEQPKEMRSKFCKIEPREMQKCTYGCASHFTAQMQFGNVYWISVQKPNNKWFRQNWIVVGVRRKRKDSLKKVQPKVVKMPEKTVPRRAWTMLYA